MLKKLTTEEFIEKAKQVHKDAYNYNKVKYVNANPQCGQIHDRDINAAKNIKRKSISELVSNGKSNKSSDLGAVTLEPRIPCSLDVGVCQKEYLPYKNFYK